MWVNFKVSKVTKYALLNKRVNYNINKLLISVCNFFKDKFLQSNFFYKQKHSSIKQKRYV